MLSMTAVPRHLGDSHNFGRRVTLRDGRVAKPRTVLWEWLVLSVESPLRRLLADAAEHGGLGRDAFDFLPDLAFSAVGSRDAGEVEQVTLDPLPDLAPSERRSLARVVGRFVALFSWLGVADLHWENLVLGAGRDGRVILAPLDVEMLFADLSLPTETKLLPDADPEYAEVCRHACGARRVLPWLGKPIEPADLLAMVASYRGALAFLDEHAGAIADAIAGVPGVREAPIRLLLRGTDEYARAKTHPLWPPLLDAEIEQLDRGDVPYFFRLYGQPGIHWYADPSLERVATLPLEGDVPQLEPLLSLSRGLKSKSRKKLRDEGLFTVIGAFDHPSFGGRHEADGVEATFTKRNVALKLGKRDELTARRDMRDFVGSVYLPCRCGEVRSPFVPPVTSCDAKLRASPRRAT